MRQAIQFTTMAFGFLLIFLFFPILLALMNQSTSNQLKVKTGTPAWNHPTVYDRNSQNLPVNSDKPFVPNTQIAHLQDQKEFQRKPGGKVSKNSDVYLVMDLSRNRLFVMRGEMALHTAVASAGSGRELRDPRDPSRWWKFETPEGTFEIQSKLIDPVWIQPDWAFIERGQPVPSDQDSRLRPGVLGEYALGFGNGYFIHGALYTNLLGQNHTHGCIQLDDEDLRFVFHHIRLGSHLIIQS